MRWNCPHCATTLAMNSIRENTESSDWIYTRCFQCGGYALVKPPRIQLMKVENPLHEGSTIIAKSPSESTQHGDIELEQPKVLSGSRNQSKRSNSVIFLGALSQTKPDFAPERPQDPSPNEEPLISAPSPTRISGAISTVNLMQPMAVDSLASTVPNISIPTHQETASASNQGTTPSTSSSGSAANTLAHSILIGLGLLASASGIYLFVEGQRLFSTAQNTLETINMSRASAIVAKPQAPTAQLQGSNSTTEIKGSAISQAPVTPTAATTEGPSEVILTTNAAATIAKVDDQKAKHSNGITVEIKTEIANLRTGPGMDYPIAGYAKARIPYVVLDWNANWFKIASAQASSNPLWIRSDLVRSIGAEDHIAK